ncbi:MAG: MBL fold metallo-hydrolase [Desulfatiglans sp.]|jgi:glyoxylase-like metal-dependent hydrolase (beta-lactamase superfamily II)|nr:MBL fold metallo-hydrolase [Thermodesulfobacteriota bacterium]MEE4353104.1 MBL fold metallo-hydrolase [Desulfatiglans sp.]
MMEEEKRERKTTRRDFLRISGAAALAASVTGFIPALKGKAGKEGNIFSGISYAGERPDYEIYALKYASADYFPGYVLHWMGRPPFVPNQPPLFAHFYYWLIKGHGMNILFDSGVTAATAKAHRLLNYEDHSTVLGKLGLKTGDIDAVVTSHAHWDHVNGIGQFPNARHYIQEACYRWTVEKAPKYPMLRKIGYPANQDIDLVVKCHMKGNLVLVPGKKDSKGEEILPGIDAIRVDGHYVGLQSLNVKTAKGPVVLASDASYAYSNYEEDWPVGIIHGEMTDALDGMQRFRKILGRNGTFVPGHDTEVLKKFPEIMPGVAKIA